MSITSKKINKIKFCTIYSTILMFLIFTCLIYSESVYFYINPIRDIFKNIIIFGDWSYVVDSIKCFNQGADIINDNYCDVSGRPWIYGSSLLYLPFSSEPNLIYLNFIPLVIIFFLSLYLNYFFKPKKISDYLIIFLLMFSTPIMLGMERANIELIIFLFLIFISFFRNLLFVNFFIMIIAGLKYYPAILLIINFINKINLKSLLIFLLSIILILLLFYLDRGQILNIINLKEIINPNGVENVGMLIFSFYTLPELARSITKELNSFNSEMSYYIFLFLNIFVFIYSFTKSVIKKKDRNRLVNFKIDKFEDRLYFLSSIMIMTIYFLEMNYVYKEIYFLGLIPFLKYKNQIYKYKIIYNLILIKFIILTLMWICQTLLFSSSIYVKGFNILVKGLIDNFLVILIMLSILEFFKQFVKINLKKISFKKPHR